MVNHFFSDITHFDGKFFKTVGTLASKPGYLSKLYMEGKRQRFLHPVRMYVFTSAVFFLVFFSFFKVKEDSFGRNGSGNKWADTQVRKYGVQAYKDAHTAQDSADIRDALEWFYPDLSEEGKSNAAKTIDTVAADQPVYRFDDGGVSDSIRATADSAEREPAEEKKTAKKKKAGSRSFQMFNGRNYKNLADYDSVQAVLPKAQKDGWLPRMLIRKGLDINDRYPDEEGKLMALLADKFLHTIPYILFVSLPLYAFFLYLVYIRRKRFFFADHAIFLIHLYIFTFILTLLCMVLNEYPFWGSSFLLGALIVYGIGYTLKAFRNYYGQGWGKTILKFILFNFLCIVSLTFLFAIFGGYALFQV